MRRRTDADVDLVDAALHASRTAARDLVSHGVGQCLDRTRAGDLVAVVVEQAVQVAQLLAAVGAQDGHAGPAQAATGERHGVGVGWR